MAARADVLAVPAALLDAVPARTRALALPAEGAAIDLKALIGRADAVLDAALGAAADPAADFARLLEIEGS